MSQAYKLAIETDGSATMIYDDQRLDLMLELGRPVITRVSEVEPRSDGLWQAKMRDGHLLQPYRLRSEALAAEVEYLEAKLF